jgi:hypothetical protein
LSSATPESPAPTPTPAPTDDDGDCVDNDGDGVDDCGGGHGLSFLLLIKIYGSSNAQIV